jgi:hypothetical protein
MYFLKLDVSVTDVAAVRWVQTEMGNMGATAIGMEKAPVTLEDSIKGMLTEVMNLFSAILFHLLAQY